MRFGIPSLDALFGQGCIPIDHAERSGTSLCLAGAAGTGKSILALHFVASYRADQGQQPKIIYISTDFSHPKAESVWKRFSLEFPEHRTKPFAFDDKRKSIFEENAPTCPLQHCPGTDLAFSKVPKVSSGFGSNQETTNTGKTVDYLWTDDDSGRILFIDLNSTRNGDEWDFVNRLLSVLPPPKRNSPKHLVVIDAVEGLEMYVGNRDSYGEVRTRRSRVTQLLRTASDKAHLFFVVEDEGSPTAPPEEFLTDYVVRSRLTNTRGYDRRTIEIVKARAQWHYRGQHMYVIRTGRGTSSPDRKDEFYADDPRHGVENGQEEPVSYVHVMHSIHGLYREQMSRQKT